MLLMFVFDQVGHYGYWGLGISWSTYLVLMGCMPNGNNIKTFYNLIKKNVLGLKLNSCFFCLVFGFVLDAMIIRGLNCLAMSICIGCATIEVIYSAAIYWGDHPFPNDDTR